MSVARMLSEYYGRLSFPHGGAHPSKYYNTPTYMFPSKFTIIIRVVSNVRCESCRVKRLLVSWNLSCCPFAVVSCNTCSTGCLRWCLRLWRWPSIFHEDQQTVTSCKMYEQSLLPRRWSWLYCLLLRRWHWCHSRFQKRQSPMREYIGICH
jgi:hypothetical protein